MKIIEIKQNIFYAYFLISLFYSDINKDTYIENIKKIKELINKDEKIKKDKYQIEKMIKSFEKFDSNKELKEMDKIFLKKWIKELLKNMLITYFMVI